MTKSERKEQKRNYKLMKLANLNYFKGPISYVELERFYKSLDPRAGVMWKVRMIYALGFAHGKEGGKRNEILQNLHRLWRAFGSR